MYFRCSGSTVVGGYLRNPSVIMLNSQTVWVRGNNWKKQEYTCMGDNYTFLFFLIIAVVKILILWPTDL